MGQIIDMAARTCVIALMFASVASGQLCLTSITNGDFSQSVAAGTTQNGWSISGTCADGPVYSTSQGRDDTGGVRLNCVGRMGDDPCMSTEITGLCIGARYTISLFAKLSSCSSVATENALIAKVDGQTVYSQDATNQGVWTQHQFSFQAPSNNAVLAICSEASGTDCDYYIDNVAIALTEAVVITQQPQNVILNTGQDATFIVQAIGLASCSSGLRFQWQRRDPNATSGSIGEWINLVDSARYLYTNTNALVIRNPNVNLATGFRCVVSSDCGASAFSQTANFDINCPADFNADGSVDGDDVIQFFANWDGGC